MPSAALSTGINLGAASGGVIANNIVRASSTALNIAAAFTGSIFG